MFIEQATCPSDLKAPEGRYVLYCRATCGIRQPLAPEDLQD